MSMGGIVHNTVVSMVVMALLAGVHPCVGTTAPQTLHLTSYPEAATDGADFTLSCTPAQGRTLISLSWHRNNINLFDTSSDAGVSAVILNPLTTSPEYQSVSRRISVSSSPKQFNVTLWTISTLDKGSVWRCQTGPQFSNNLTIELKESIQVSISVYATKHPGTDEQILKLTCEGTDDITETVWSRNSVNIFQTILPRSMLVYDTDSPEYQSVSGCISVSSSLQQHNVTLRTNSTLDHGSVWMCKAGSQFSNNLTIELKESIQEGPVTTIGAISLATSEDGHILPITAAAGSIIVVIVIVVASATSVLIVRKYKQDIAESNSQMYSTMSRDPYTENNYTELDHGHTGDKFPTSLAVNTEESPVYYNTAPADSQYKNPPVSIE